MRTLHFIRHGPVQVDFALESSDWELAPSAAGLVTALAEKLKPVVAERLVSSSHVKAIQTAEILSAELDLPVEVRSGLEEHHREKRHHVPSGVAFLETMTQFFARPDEIVFGSESAATALKRFREGVSAVMAESGRDEIIVGHGAVLALLLGQGGNGAAHTIWKGLEQPDYVRIEWPGLRRITD